MTTGEKLRMHREERGWSRARLASISNTRIKWIRDVEEEKLKPHLDGLPLLIVALKLDIDVEELWPDP